MKAVKDARCHFCQSVGTQIPVAENVARDKKTRADVNHAKYALDCSQALNLQQLARKTQELRAAEQQLPDLQVGQIMKAIKDAHRHFRQSVATQTPVAENMVREDKPRSDVNHAKYALASRPSTCNGSRVRLKSLERQSNNCRHLAQDRLTTKSDYEGGQRRPPALHSIGSHSDPCRGEYGA
jgi:hypothetical protein